MNEQFPDNNIGKFTPMRKIYKWNGHSREEALEAIRELEDAGYIMRMKARSGRPWAEDGYMIVKDFEPGDVNYERYVARKAE